MLIQCSKKLLDQLKLPAVPGNEEDEFFSWHAHMVMINRRKTVVLVNDSSLYVVVLYGLKAKEFQNLGRIAKDGIRKTFEAEGMKDEVIEKYLDALGEVSFAKTKNRSTVARMNKACETVLYFEEDLDLESMYQPQLGKRLSGMYAGKGKVTITPSKEMFKLLETFAGEPIIRKEAAQLLIKLDGTDVWRRLAVPLFLPFARLHYIIQEAFNWTDSHQHEFHLEGNFFFEVDSTLADLFPKYQELDYIYDLGDNWEHHIIFEKVIEDYSVNYPICLEGEGNTPPEDVGGAGGYAEFLRILADPSDPNHEHMREWAKWQGYKEFDIKSVNWNLKHF
ncbi:plasmid pRiA4b ORF-3 family protein [Bacillus massilinigeriensis]|uniref:plasmid pRiA4b ORF-3 family protein n=1 Tax=Bacillus mediterraneensis TaxID=1805474 RepID=UPI0008F94E6A|nr:plasmid pRiA4b ORF-3 family protein [Bacillus mediterraneensis]